MRETLSRFQRRLPGQRLEKRLFKLYLYLLLQALDYLHRERHIIHTGETVHVRLLRACY